MGTSTGTIVGLVIGGVVAVVMIVVIGWLISRQKIVSQAATKGFKYQTGQKLNYAVCVATHFGKVSRCTAPVKGKNTPASQDPIDNLTAQQRMNKLFKEHIQNKKQ